MTDSKSFSDRLAQLGPARAALLAVGLVLLSMAVDSAPQQWLRAQLFDAYQRLLPRQRISEPAMVVAIDESSLERIGQWPWPRNRLGDLIAKIAEASPAAIGIDIFMPEPDRLSPRRALEGVAQVAPALQKEVERLPDNDALFAAAIRDKRVVLAVAGSYDAPSAADEQRPIHAAPVLLKGDLTGLQQVPQYASAVRSRPEMEAAAAGQGIINPDPQGTVIRRVNLLGRVGETLMPNLEVELLRIAYGQPVIQGRVDASGVREVRVAHLGIPTDDDGAVWLRYAGPAPGRVVSAADVLEGKIDPVYLTHKLVLVGPTGLGLIDQQPTPMGTRTPGIEIRAELIENIFENSWLVRPHWVPWSEAALFLVMALTYAMRLPRATPTQGFLLFAALTVAAGLVGLISFNLGLLIDVGTPITGSALVFTAVLGSTLADTQRQRRDLAARLQSERESAARLAGELETARRVQMGMLPESPGMLAGDARVDLKAFMEPARSVGGDLYDFFLLDGRRLFVLIGDVSGKGLGAAMFMALIKSLCKGAVMRQPDSLEKALAQAEDEIRRENPESLFVTMLVVSLDLDTGEFTYCNAGHDPLYGLKPGSAAPRRIDHGGRPPLCVLEDYPYPLGRDRLDPGETLCMITDGITEATSRSGQLYGHKRLEQILSRTHAHGPAELVDAVREDVTAFAGGAEQSDDMSIVALRWNGGGGTRATGS